MAKTKKTKVLVGWNEIPEVCCFLELEVDAATADKLHSFNGHYVNAGRNDALEMEINDFFYDKEGVFKFTKLDGPVKLKDFDFAIITGFIL